MLLSKDAIADVVEVLRGNDFYRPAHELVFEAILDLYGRGEPADAVTVAAELHQARRARPDRRRRLPAHADLPSVPTAANAGYYARIVRERAVLRRLVEAGTRIVQLGYATGGGDVDDIVDAAQAEVYDVTERRTTEDYLPLSAIIEGTIDEIEAIGSRGGGHGRRPDRLRRPRRADQRPAPRPDDRHRGTARPWARRWPSTPRCRRPPAGRRWARSRSATAARAPTAGRRRWSAATEVMTGRPCYEVEFSDGR